MSKDFIGLFPNVLSPEHCEMIIKEMENNQKYDAVDLKKQYGGAGHRSGTAYFIRTNHGWDLTRNLINEATTRCVRAYVEEYPTMNISCASHTIKLQKLEPGEGFHDWHCEAFNYATSHRVLFWMVYLNTNSEGEGMTEWIIKGVRVQPEQGKVVICPSGFTHTHRGNASYTDTKYIATGWYTHQGT